MHYKISRKNLTGNVELLLKIVFALPLLAGAIFVKFYLKCNTLSILLLFRGNVMPLFLRRGEDIFISVWNLHRSPKLWDDADKFKPERWPIDGPNPNETNQNFKYLPILFSYLSASAPFTPLLLLRRSLSYSR